MSKVIPLKQQQEITLKIEKSRQSRSKIHKIPLNKKVKHMELVKKLMKEADPVEIEKQYNSHAGEVAGG